MSYALFKAFDPVRIILFCSVARGEARPDSNVDLLVVLPAITHRREQGVAIRRVLADLPISKDIIVATPEEVEEGRVLYERSA